MREETVLCACGCGSRRLRFDKDGRERRFLRGHKSLEHRRASAASLLRGKPPVPWNKGRSYVFAKRSVYANKGAWQAALKRLYGDRCMRCGWDEATCDAHHLAPKREGGEFTLENGVILCPNCHRLAEVGTIDRPALTVIRRDAPVTGAVVRGKR